MGWLSKAGKSVKKAFKKVMGFIGKIAGSKWGKILMAAITVFTLGTALIAGLGSFASTTGTFMTKFIAGAKQFVAALASPLKTAKGLFGNAASTGAQAAGTAAQSTAAANAAAQASAGATAAGAEAATAGVVPVSNNPMGVLTSTGDAATVAAEQAAAGGAAGAAGAAAGTGAATAAPATGGLLKKAAGVAGKILTSPAAGQMVGGLAQGYAAGKQQEELLKAQEREARYYDEQWRDPEKFGKLASAVRDVNVPGGYLARARRVSDFMQGRPAASAPSAPGKPEDVYGSYVVGYQ